MRATLLTWRKYLVYYFLKFRRTIRLHIESSVKLSREDADVLVSRLRKTNSAKDLPQIKDGDERKIVNFKSKCAAKKTLRDLPMMMANPQDHWFETSVVGQGGNLRKSSQSYHRLQAYVSNLKADTDNEIDNPNEPAMEHA